VDDPNSGRSGPSRPTNSYWLKQTTPSFKSFHPGLQHLGRMV
jgi:hypothetical protein